MGRWQLVDSLIRELEQVPPGGGNFGPEVDEKLREFEVLAAKAEPIGVFDTPKKRQREFEEELRRTLDDRLKQEPSNPVWREVLMLLDFPQLRSKSR